MDDSVINQERLNKMIKKYKMNTDLKRIIFIAIATAVDYLDAFEKLMRLSLKREPVSDYICLFIYVFCFNVFCICFFMFIYLCLIVVIGKRDYKNFDVFVSSREVL